MELSGCKFKEFQLCIFMKTHFTCVQPANILLNEISITIISNTNFSIPRSQNWIIIPIKDYN